MSRLFVASAAALALLSACGSDDSGGAEGEGEGPAEGEGEGGAEGEGEGEGGGQAPDLAALDWDTETVTEGEGLHARLAVRADGTPVAAYFKHVSNEGTCDLGDWGTIGEYDVTVAERGESGWSEAVVDRVTVLYGLGLDLDASGNAHLAYLGGTPGTQGCGGSDLQVATGGGGAYASATVHSDSATSSECRKMQDVCNQGNVTGLWSALAFSPDGSRAAVAFQDVHFGFAKEDWESADQELAIGPGGWAVVTVDDSFGGGRYADVALGADGGIGVAWYNGKLGGIWFKQEADGGWDGEAVEVDPGETAHPIQLEALPGGGWGLAFFHSHADVQALYYAHSADGVEWTVDPVDETAHTGTSPSMAVDRWGRPVIAYGRCNELGEDVCHENRDGVMLARWDGRRWQREAIPAASDDEFREGDVVALDVTPDGVPRVVYTRTRFDAGTGGVVAQVRAALAK